MTTKRAEEAPDFVKDEDLGALLNTNNRGLKAYREQREAMRRNLSLQSRIDMLESNLDQIKELLQQALKR